MDDWENGGFTTFDPITPTFGGGGGAAAAANGAGSVACLGLIETLLAIRVDVDVTVVVTLLVMTFFPSFA